MTVALTASEPLKVRHGGEHQIRAIDPADIPSTSRMHWMMRPYGSSDRSCTRVAEKVEVPAMRTAEMSTETYVSERVAARWARLWKPENTSSRIELRDRFKGRWTRVVRTR